MAEVILNILPLHEDERAPFLEATPGVEQRFFRGLTDDTKLIPLTDLTLLEDVTVVLGSLSPTLIPLVPNLKWLQTWSAGVDYYLKPNLLPDATMITSAVGAYGPSVSEHLFATLLTLCKRLHTYRDQQFQGIWKDLGPIKTLDGATVLMVGAGDIGSRFCTMCKAMGAHTIGLKRTLTPPPAGIDEIHAIDQLDDFLPQADVVCLAVPHAPETIHLMDARRLALMKSDAILLNGGRGSAVDPDALLAALRSGHLWGVGLDVTEPEPLPQDHPLWQEPKLLLTPHIAGGLHLSTTRTRINQIALENLKHYLADQPLRNRMR